MKADDVAAQAIALFNKRITNEIFLTIQNNRDLMLEYLRAVEAEGLDQVNMRIGKAVKVKYDLKSINERDDNPSCTLIQSHQKLELK